MLLKKLTMNEQKVQKLLKSLLCFVCVFCFAGCESDSTPVSVQPQHDDIERWAENQQSENVGSRKIEQLDKMNKHLAEENNSRNLSAFPVPEPPSNSRTRLQTQDSRAENQDLGPASGVWSLESDRAITTSEQLFSQGNPQLVNMPALNKPGMADDKNASYRRDELISVNFERADIRTVLKTVGDITGINFVVD